jgi:hypothetical protein
MRLGAELQELVQQMNENSDDPSDDRGAGWTLRDIVDETPDKFGGCRCRCQIILSKRWDISEQ